MRPTILITGASRGIGKALALSLAGKDINIVINCKNNPALLEDVRNEILQKGTSCSTYVGDVGDYHTVADMFDYIIKQYGQIDILINNAGISSVGLFQDTGQEEWKNIMSSNLDSVYNCCHFAVIDMLKRHSGKIINISSVWGIYGASCEVAYSASKGAINAMTKALAKELAPSNIQVNAIACGAIETDMNSHLDDREKLELSQEIPVGRLGTVHEVAELVNSLISMNSYLTGQVIQLDGGWI